MFLPLMLEQSRRLFVHRAHSTVTVARKPWLRDFEEGMLSSSPLTQRKHISGIVRHFL